jgi:hypothetical protein
MAGYEWVELYNGGDLPVDVNGWYITDNDGWKFYLSGAGSIPQGGYLICHLAETGTNSSTDVYGAITNQTVLQPDASEGKDNFLDSTMGISCTGAFTLMTVMNNTAIYKRPILQFDLSSLPSGSISDAKIWLYRQDGHATIDATVNLHKVTQVWTEGDNTAYSGANWGTYNGTASWPVNTNGGDYDTTSEDTKTVVAGTNAWYYWNVTEMMGEWINDSSRNYGMILIANDGSETQSFYSSDHATGPSLIPKLVVNLTSNIMLEDSDDLALMNSAGSIIDYVAWGGDARSDDNVAVTYGHWADAQYVDSSEFAENETLGRDEDSTDTNSYLDWENATTDKGDPYGVNATAPTKGSQNTDFIIPEFSTFMIPVVSVVFIFVIGRKRYILTSSTIKSKSVKAKRQKKREVK